MNKNRLALLFTVSALVAGAATASTTASAGSWRRVSAQSCTSDTAFGNSGQLVSYGYGFQMKPTSSTTASFVCGIVEDANINDSNVASDWIDVVIPPSGGSAYALSCVDWYYGQGCSGGYCSQGGDCSGSASTNTAGFTSLKTSTAIWNGSEGTYNYPYLHVSLTGAGTEFVGYGVATN